MEQCGLGYYSLQGEPLCTPCPAGYRCPQTQDSPIACDPGYYRYTSSDTDSCCPQIKNHPESLHPVRHLSVLWSPEQFRHIARLISREGYTWKNCAVALTAISCHHIVVATFVFPAPSLFHIYIVQTLHATFSSSATSPVRAHVPLSRPHSSSPLVLRSPLRSLLSAVPTA